MPPSELLSEIERLLEVVRQQQQQIQSQQEMIERLENQVTQQGERIKQLEEELRAQKKLKRPGDRIAKCETAAFQARIFMSRN
ncbi:MAG: hypothetical protein ACKO63_17625 [Nodosilinea sp.]